MRLTDIPALMIEDAVRKWRRRLLVGLVALVFGFAVIIELVSATRFALEAAVGPVFARLIMAAIFASVIGVSVLLLWRAERQSNVARKAKAADSDERVTIIAEAINLGYSLARDLAKARQPDAPPPQADVASPPVGAPDAPAAKVNGAAPRCEPPAPPP